LIPWRHKALFAGAGEQETIMQADDAQKQGGLSDAHDKPVDPSDKIEEGRDRHTEQALDHGLKETFPASDPVSISPAAD